MHYRRVIHLRICLACGCTLEFSALFRLVSWYQAGDGIRRKKFHLYLVRCDEQQAEDRYENEMNKMRVSATAGLTMKWNALFLFSQGL